MRSGHHPPHLPNRRAAGVPLIHGERRVGETLTADITGITDPEGLSDPRFNYSWIRGDGVDEESITGEESETYTLKDDDAGQRIKTLVTFLDNEEGRETAVGPATSVITPDPRVLVSNASKADGTNPTSIFPHPSSREQINKAIPLTQSGCGVVATRPKSPMRRLNTDFTHQYQPLILFTLTQRTCS